MANVAGRTAVDDVRMTEERRGSTTTTPCDQQPWVPSSDRRGRTEAMTVFDARADVTRSCSGLLVLIKHVFLILTLLCACCHVGMFIFPNSRTLHCVSKNIPDIFDCNLKTNYQILIIFGKNISDTTCHQTTIHFPISPHVCFCTH